MSEQELAAHFTSLGPCLLLLLQVSGVKSKGQSLSDGCLNPQKAGAQQEPTLHKQQTTDSLENFLCAESLAGLTFKYCL